MRGADEYDGAVAVGSFDLGKKGFVRIPVVTDRLQDLAGHGVSEVRGRRRDHVAGDVSDNARLRRADWLRDECAVFVRLHDARDFQHPHELLDPDLDGPLPAANILVGVLQHPRVQGRCTITTAVDTESRRVRSPVSVVRSVLPQLIRVKAEPELLLEPTSNGLEYGPLSIAPLDTQMVRID